MAEKTKICCLDIDKDILEFLKEDHELYFGTMGCKVSMSANRSSSVQVQPNYRYPSNIQENDVFIVDMGNTKVKAYTQEDYASHIISDTIAAGLIKTSVPEGMSKKYATYVPYYC